MQIRSPLVAFAILTTIAACSGDQRVDTDSAAGQPAADPAPIFTVGLWPGEGIPVIAAARDTLPLLRSPAAAAAVAGTLEVHAGQELTYDSTRVQTIAPATVRVTDSAELHGRFLGELQLLSREAYYSTAFPDTTITLAPGTTVEYLQPRAEGTCFVRVGDAILDADPCPTLDTTRFAVAGEPQTSWWVFARGDSASGWLLVSDSTAEVVRRKF